MKATQHSKIFSYCQEHGSITVRDMCVKLGMNSPTKRISEMRHSLLYNVQSVDEERTNEDGDTVRYKRYFIQKAVQS
jgi:hypothetical protein